MYTVDSISMKMIYNQSKGEVFIIWAKGFLEDSINPPSIEHISSITRGVSGEKWST